MKTFKLLFLIGILCSLLSGCSKDEVTTNNEELLKSAQPVKVTLPFEAHLLGNMVIADFENPECIQEGYAAHVIVEAEGTATHMGKVNVTFDFCAIGPDDPDIPGEDYKYTGGIFTLEAANGDQLFIDMEGSSVIVGRTEDHPEYVVDYFRYKITILGGTGRFEGASGELHADDYDTNLNDYSVHNWYGEITLVKGKR